MFKFSTIFAQNLQVGHKFLTCLCQHNAKMAQILNHPIFPKVYFMLKLPKFNQLFNKSPKLAPPTETALNTATQAGEQVQSLYRKLSGKSLSLAVKAEVLGEVVPLDKDVATFYVLREYSRSNSLLIDIKTQELGLPEALAPKAWASYTKAHRSSF